MNKCLNCGKDCKYTFCSDECMGQQMVEHKTVKEIRQMLKDRGYPKFRPIKQGGAIG